MSTCAMTQPPKMSPLALQSAGIGTTLSTSSLSVGSGTRGAITRAGLDGMADDAAGLEAEDMVTGRIV